MKATNDRPRVGRRRRETFAGSSNTNDLRWNLRRRARGGRVNVAVDRTAAYSWRFLVIGLALYAALWLTEKLIVVVVPVLLALLLARGLHPVSQWLQRHKWKSSLSSMATLGGFLIVLLAVLGTAGARFASQFDELGSTISAGLDDAESWLIGSETLDLNANDLAEWRERISGSIFDFFSSSDGAVLTGAASVGKAILGAFLTVIVTFFLLKDGDRFWAVARKWFPAAQSDLVGRCGQRAWDALGSYLRGAALLGVVEASVIGLTLVILRADLIVPVMVVTVIAAFVPIVGAIAAGVVAVLVALVTVGTTGAIIMAVVALVLQQLDNDLLAPVIYGRALRIHALGILLGIAAGGALFGFIGSVFAVPVLAVLVNVGNELRGSQQPMQQNSADRSSGNSAPTSSQTPPPAVPLAVVAGPESGS